MNSRRKFIKQAGIASAGALFLQSFIPDKKSLPEKSVLKPQRLKSGDTVAISSPAGAVWDDKQINTFAGILKGFGFNVIFGETLKQKFGYFSGSDEFRANELNELFANKKVKGIFSMKGGWGCARILDKLNYELIEKNPKVLIGFSDITTLLNVIYAKTGLITFHGPVGNSGWNDFTSTSFKKVIMKGEACEFPLSPKMEDAFCVLNKGKASGELLGGNLSVLTGLLGSNYLPDWKGKILFLEEVKEEPYRIDKMLTQLKLNGVLNELAGIIFGKFSKCEAEEPQKAFTFMEVLEQHIKPLGIPSFYGAAIGHTENKITVPVGIKAEMDAEKGMMKLMESAVL
ncbi:MAG: LD-carboxypeptidase [Bacteroidota bacterium]|nr:LD-carboxypeptidase [Bacteroidota bacterium]